MYFFFSTFAYGKIIKHYMIMKAELVDLKTAQNIVCWIESFHDVHISYYYDRNLKIGVVNVIEDFDSSVPVCIFTFYVSYDDLLTLVGL